MTGLGKNSPASCEGQKGQGTLREENVKKLLTSLRSKSEDAERIGAATGHPAGNANDGKN